MLPSKFTGASAVESAILQYPAIFCNDTSACHSTFRIILHTSLSETQDEIHIYLLQECHTKHESKADKFCQQDQLWNRSLELFFSWLYR